ncbi:MAG: ABC transporter ATP-binding protein [Acidimicrobiia bacterium]|nr:ABC transporter ATP-binding protein [Acidimicrobiia bacterium]
MREARVSLRSGLPGLLGPFRPHLAGILALSLLAAPLALLLPVPLKIAVDSVIGDQPAPGWFAMLLPVALSKTALLVACGALLIVATLLVYLRGMASWLLQTWTGERMVLDFRGRLFDHAQRLSLGYHDTKGAVDSVYRIQYDADSAQHLVINGLAPLISSLFTLLGMVAVMALLDFPIAVVALLICPVLYGLMWHYSPQLRERWDEVKTLDSAAMGVVQEALSTLRVVKAFGGETREQGRFLAHSRRRVEKLLGLVKIESRFDLFVGMTLAAGSAAVLVLGILHVQAGRLTLGELLLVMTYLAQIYEPLRTMSKKVADVQKSLASLRRAFDLLEESREVPEAEHPLALRRARGEIVFDNVSFRYSAGQQVLDGISFQAPPGCKVGIQGRTGAGKSTLMSLLMRFYDPQQGEIRLDGRNLRDYKLDDLRDQFAIVLQEPVLFSTTIGENIAYGRPGASIAEIRRAARLASADEFIESLPEGYDTTVGERGMMLSGGERQRISLARAFLKDAPILILDEPTSAVDTATESAILEATERLMEGRTAFLIAHRLSTLEHCDLRLEVRGGRLLPIPAAGRLEPAP